MQHNSSQSSDDQSTGFYSHLRSSTQDDGGNTNSGARESAVKTHKNEKQSDKADADGKVDANATVVPPQTTQPAPASPLLALLGLPNMQKADADETGKTSEDEGKAALSVTNAQGKLDVLQSSKDRGKSADPAVGNFPLLSGVPSPLSDISNLKTNSGVGSVNAPTDAVVDGASGNNMIEVAAAEGSSNKAATTLASSNVAFALRVSEGELNSKAQEAPQPANSADVTGGVALSRLTNEANLAAAVQAAAGSQLKEQSQQHDDGSKAASLYEVPQAQPRNATDTSQATGEQPVHTAATALGAEQETSNSEPVRNVHMQVVGDNNSRVDVRLMDRGGELHVSVKSGDTDLARNLQDHMPELTSRLEQQRFQTEVWMPKAADNAKPEMAGARDFSSSGNNGSNDSNSSDRQRKGQQQYKPDWVDVLENSTRGTGKSNQTWQQ